jgi:peptidoglycan hydrolase CwlO-like protein
MFFLKKKIIFFFLAIFLLGFFRNFVYAEDSGIQECRDNNKSVADCPAYLQGKLSLLQGQATTLSSQIAIMNSQINLTQAKIEANKREILDLTLDIDTATKKIVILQDSLKKITDVWMKRVVATYEVGGVQPMVMLLSSSDVSNLLVRLNYLRIVKRNDEKLIVDVQQAKNDYVNQKDIYETKKAKVEALKKQLEAYTSQLSQEKQSKQDLLAQTQGNEATYQQLLAKAQAELSALSNFARSASGGVRIISHSDLSDSWGKYYNQRDANWGNNLIGLSSESIWDVGCLLTSYAMVTTHYGSSITPADVAADSGNFSFGTAYFKKPGPAANGHSAENRDNPSLQELRDALNSGAAVVAGLSRNGGPYPIHYSDHWVVLRSIDGDSFKINDPEYEGAMNVSLNEHYSGWTIIESRIYR